ncbi:MAG: TRAP transporter substrate-binding protein [Betaproteobacteria bacterium]
MKTSATFVRRAAFAAALVLVSGFASAQTLIKVGLTLPKGLKGGAPLTGAFEVFKEEVEKNSNGQLRVDLVYGAALGNEFERLNQVRRGVIQMCDCNEATIATVYKDIQVFSMPFLFPTEAIALQTLDGPLGTRAARQIQERTGIRLLGWLEHGGFKHYSGNAPLARPEDMKGRKMRVQGPIFAIPVQAMGGSAVAIPFPELYTSLKTGVVDGQDNAVWAFNVAKLYEVQKYLTLSGHIYAFGPMSINDAFFTGLSPALQTVVTEAAKKGVAFNRSASRNNEAQELELAKSNGVNVIVLSREAKAAFFAATQPKAIEWLNQNIDTPALVNEVVAAVRAASK